MVTLAQVWPDSVITSNDNLNKTPDASENKRKHKNGRAINCTPVSETKVCSGIKKTLLFYFIPFSTLLDKDGDERLRDGKLKKIQAFDFPGKSENLRCSQDSR